MSAPWRNDYRSWGGTQTADHLIERPAGRDAAAAAVAAGGSTASLPVACGRSYGDVNLNPGGRLIDCRGLDRFISFDRDSGILRCEAGVQIADILAVACRPEADGSAWFLPVSPGTRFVSVGGAIANDVHGKNHHRFGTFGRHVLSLELARTDGTRQVCSASENGALFAATIGGLGLTGLILAATLRLRRVPGTALAVEEVRFQTLDEFFAISQDSDRDWEYTAAWVDCQAGGSRMGRGIFSRANHAAGVAAAPPPRAPRVHVPLRLPFSLVNNATGRCFNALYWSNPIAKRGSRRVAGCAPVLYPLDALGDWNRLYGRSGFYQFQCVLPPAMMRSAIAELLKTVAASGERSTLAVLKMFGDVPSPGLLSFPMPGATLALDFANRGATTRGLLGRLEGLTREAGGRLYPAKDAVMSAETFNRGFGRTAEFRALIDPGIGSAFARRVGLVSAAEH
jgi:FAD/FMN-containing dehydrogenase